jgi:hypothetical protein
MIKEYLQGVREQRRIIKEVLAEEKILKRTQQERRDNG